MNDSERLQISQWILEQHLHWIAAAEVKTGVVVTIDMAMLGALAAAFSAVAPHQRTFWANYLTLASAALLAIAIFCVAMSVLPRTTGPESSFIFFGKIVKRTVSDYAAAFRKASDAELLEDCLAQVHRNAEIACDKFQWVRTSMLWSFGAIGPWVAALVYLIDP